MILCFSMADTPEDYSKLEQIYQRYKNLMFYTANNLLHNAQDAEDAVQQAFLSILKNLEKISEVDSPKTRSFVVIIVERKAIDMLRSRSRENTLPLDEAVIAGEVLPIPGDGGLADAMARLPKSYRDVLLLKYDNGFSTHEIAAMLGITDSGVRKLVGRAKKLLKETLEKEGMEL